MITEIAQIDVKPGMEADFETGVKNAAPIFKRAKGCHGMELRRSIEKPEPLPAVRDLGDRGRSHCRFPRLARFPGMAKTRRPLLRLAARGRACPAGRARFLRRQPALSRSADSAHIGAMAKDPDRPSAPKGRDPAKHSKKDPARPTRAKASRPDAAPLDSALADLLNPAIGRGRAGVGSQTGIEPHGSHSDTSPRRGEVGRESDSEGGRERGVDPVGSSPSSRRRSASSPSPRWGEGK